MAHIPEEAHIVAYYLAKFQNSYKNLEPQKNMTDLLTTYSRFFSMPDSSLKRLRDEYDAFFPTGLATKALKKENQERK